MRGYNNSTIKRPPDNGNERILKALERGPLGMPALAAITGLTRNAVYNRLYRMKSLGKVDGGKRHNGHTWALTNNAPSFSKKVQPRQAPDWRTTTLDRDPFAAMKLAMVTR